MAVQDNCRATIKAMDCGGPLPTQAPNVYPPFDVCLPLGRTLSWDGVGLRLSGRVTVPDGVYGLVTVVSGCIVGVGEQPVCEYTPAACTPAAEPCGSDTSSVPLQPGTDNLLNFDGAGRLGASLNYTAQTPIVVTGSGTASDPLVFSYQAEAQESTYVQQGDGPISVSGDGSGTAPYVISHGVSPLTSGTYGNYTLDDYGHIIAYAADSGVITSIIATGGVDITTEGTIARVGLTTQNSNGRYTLGAFDASIDLYGRVTNVTQVSEVSAGEYDFKKHLVTLNSYGTITGLRDKTDAVANVFCEIFSGARDETAVTFTTEETGYFKITYEGNLGGGSSSLNFYNLPAAYALYVDSRRVAAYAKSSAITTVNASNQPVLSTALTYVVALTDGYYAAGTHTVELRRVDGSQFTDIGFLTVMLVGRGT